MGSAFSAGPAAAGTVDSAKVAGVATAEDATEASGAVAVGGLVEVSSVGLSLSPCCPATFSALSSSVTGSRPDVNERSKNLTSCLAEQLQLSETRGGLDRR